MNESRLKIKEPFEFLVYNVACIIIIVIFVVHIKTMVDHAASYLLAACLFV